MITDSGDHDHPSVAKFRPVRFFLEKGELDGNKTAIDETVTRDSTTQTRTETQPRAIARACRVGVGTVSEYVRRAARAGLEWPLPEELDEAALEARLFSSAGPGSRERVVPDVERIHQELKRVGVTLHLLWEEYREANPKGYAYSQFCVIYGRWAQKLKPSMRQVHRAGEKTFIDFSGKRPELTDPSHRQPRVINTD